MRYKSAIWRRLWAVLTADEYLHQYAERTAGIRLTPTARAKLPSAYGKLLAILAIESWIIDGNYSRTLEIRPKYCDTVFLLDYPVEVCLGGAYARLGKEREDIPWSENELEEKFRKFIEDFPKTKLPGIYKLLEQYGDGKEIHVFHSREEAEQYLEG